MRSKKLHCIIAILILLFTCVSCATSHPILPDISAVPPTLTHTAAPTVPPATAPPAEHDDGIVLAEENNIPKAQLPDAATPDSVTASPEEASNTHMPTMSSRPSPTPIPVPEPKPNPSPAPEHNPSPTPKHTMAPTPVQAPSPSPPISDNTTTIKVDTENGNVSVSGTSFNDEVLNLIALINKERKDKELSILEYDSSLCDSALIRAAEITVKWSHTRPNGSKYSTSGSGINGEILAYRYTSSSSVVTAWMDSESHREIILMPAINRIGGSILDVGGTIYWVLHFGT